MAWKDVLGAAFIADIGRDVFTKLIFGAGDAVAKKVTNDFGGDNDPTDERWDMESSRLMDPAKREVWNQINTRINDNGGDGPIIARLREKMATKRRVNFAAMIKDIPVPTIKSEKRNSRGKVTDTIHTPDPNFKPLATEVKEYCVDMFLAEQQAQVAAGTGKKKAIEIAQQKVEIFLSGAGFPIVSERNVYRHLDEFIVGVPESALKVAKAAKAIIEKISVSESIVDGICERSDEIDKENEARGGITGFLMRHC